MLRTCVNVQHMKMIQIRNVPDDLHRTLKARAAEQGVSLSGYLLKMAERAAHEPTLEELQERLRRLPKLRPGARSSAEIIREMRGPLGR